MSFTKITTEEFRRLPPVLKALKNPRSPRSVLNYMCGCDTSDPNIRNNLSEQETVEPLLKIWFLSGNSLDDLCQPFCDVVRELKNNPETLVGSEWDTHEAKVAKVLLADQLSRSCFRGTSEAFSFDPIGRELVHELFKENNLEETLKLPAAFLYLLPWALAHSEDIRDLVKANSIIDLSIKAYPNFSSFEGRNKLAVDQHRQVLEKFGRYPHRNAEFNRENSEEEKAWLENKEMLPIWAGGKLSFNKKIK